MTLSRRTPMPRPSNPLERRKRLESRSQLARSEMPRPRKPINPMSKRQRVKIKERAELRKQLVVERGPWCEVRSPVCTGREQGLHHLHKTGQGGEDSRENCLLSCNACNVWIEDNPDEAYARGLTVKSWEKGAVA